MEFSLIYKSGKRCAVSSGFTLIELLVALSILVFLISVAVPSYSQFRSHSQITSEQHKLQSLLSLARLRSIQTGYDAIICNRSDAATCVPGDQVGALQWNNGALLYLDKDGNLEYSPSTDDLLAVTDLSPRTILFWNQGAYLVYENDGTLRGGSNGTFTLSVDGSIIKIVLSMTGRMRVVNDG